MRTKSRPIQVYLSEEEHEALRLLCSTTGLSASCIVRKLILGHTIHPLPPADYITFAQQLRYIGNNLNQLTRKANALNVIDAQRYDEAIKDLNRLYAAISDALGFEVGG